jgi:hypothetical protein
VSPTRPSLLTAASMSSKCSSCCLQVHTATHGHSSKVSTHAGTHSHTCTQQQGQHTCRVHTHRNTGTAATSCRYTQPHMHTAARSARMQSAYTQQHKDSSNAMQVHTATHGHSSKVSTQAKQAWDCAHDSPAVPPLGGAEPHCCVFSQTHPKVVRLQDQRILWHALPEN